jgi:hypothetical protein
MTAQAVCNTIPANVHASVRAHWITAISVTRDTISTDPYAYDGGCFAPRRQSSNGLLWCLDGQLELLQEGHPVDTLLWNKTRLSSYNPIHREHT